MRLIDADELIKVIVKEYSNFRGLGAELAELIDLQPTFDPWHYPSKGEYPTEKVLILMKIPGCYVLGWYDDGNWFKDGDETLILQRFVSRWLYIIPPPKEER